MKYVNSILKYCIKPGTVVQDLVGEATKTRRHTVPLLSFVSQDDPPANRDQAEGDDPVYTLDTPFVEGLHAPLVCGSKVFLKHPVLDAYVQTDVSEFSKGVAFSLSTGVGIEQLRWLLVAEYPTIYAVLYDPLRIRVREAVSDEALQDALLVSTEANTYAYYAWAGEYLTSSGTARSVSVNWTKQGKLRESVPIAVSSKNFVVHARFDPDTKRKWREAVAHLVALMRLKPRSFLSTNPHHQRLDPDNHRDARAFTNWAREVGAREDARELYRSSQDWLRDRLPALLPEALAMPRGTDLAQMSFHCAALTSTGRNRTRAGLAPRYTTALVAMTPATADQGGMEVFIPMSKWLQVVDTVPNIFNVNQAVLWSLPAVQMVEVIYEEKDKFYASSLQIISVPEVEDGAIVGYVVKLKWNQSMPAAKFNSSFGCKRKQAVVEFKVQTAEDVHAALREYLEQMCTHVNVRICLDQGADVHAQDYGLQYETGHIRLFAEISAGGPDEEGPVHAPEDDIPF